MWLLARHGSARDCELPSVRAVQGGGLSHGLCGAWREGGSRSLPHARVVLGGGRGRGSHRRVRRAACECAGRDGGAPTDASVAPPAGVLGGLPQTRPSRRLR
eukprot:4692476-Prymnesium_polylepis.1